MIIERQRGSALPWFIAGIAVAAAVYLGIRGGGESVAAEQRQAIAMPPALKDVARVAIIFPKDPGRKPMVVDGSGEPVASCHTCTEAYQQKYGPDCAKAPPQARVCKALKPMVPIEAGAIPWFHARGSDCWFFYPSGDELVGYPPGCLH